MPAQGIYEYVIARTKYIDAIFEEALARGFDQILIFGAGFDTRALRFRNKAGKTRVFELDAPVTQTAKIGQYHNRGLDIPANLVWVPVDFDREPLSMCLEKAGFDKDGRSLFILEGLLMYLLPGSVNETFGTIQHFATTGSEIVFDYVYASVLRGEGLRYGEKGMANTVSKAGEGWRFGMEEGGVGAFLARYGMSVIEEKDSTGLEEMYFTGCTGAAGNKVGRVNDTHCLVHGVVDSNP
jgi:methyltransferase (TIGR00027 family)